MTRLLRRAVFLDRDGVINRNCADHVKSWAEFEFLPGALASLQRLAQLPCLVIVVSNQSIIGRGLVSQAVVDEIHQRMMAEIDAAGGRIDAVFYCPHQPDEGCGCRKPQPGLLLQAARELAIDLTRSFLIGDAESDVRAAQAAGCLPLLVRTGRGQAQELLLRQQGLNHVLVIDDLASAVAWIESHGAW